jgi:hypothetical protein
MIKLILGCVVAFMAPGCGVTYDGDAPPDLHTPLYVQSSGCMWRAEGNGLACLPDTKEGCICGQPDPVTGGPTGSCHTGDCCTGCWDQGDLEKGWPSHCWPGDGTMGMYGEHGEGCRAWPTIGAPHN